MSGILSHVWGPFSRLGSSFMSGILFHVWNPLSRLGSSFMSGILFLPAKPSTPMCGSNQLYAIREKLGWSLYSCLLKWIPAQEVSTV